MDWVSLWPTEGYLYPRVGPVHVTTSSFISNEGSLPDLRTLGPQFEEKPASSRLKLSTIVSAMAILLWQSTFFFRNHPANP